MIRIHANTSLCESIREYNPLAPILILLTNTLDRKIRLCTIYTTTSEIIAILSPCTNTFINYHRLENDKRINKLSIKKNVVQYVKVEEKYKILPQSKYR